MRMLRRILPLVAALAVGASLTGANAAVETQVYLHCNGETPVGNAHATLDSRQVSWDEDRPTGGPEAACGTVDTFATGTSFQNPIYDFPISGTVDGPIENVTVRLWGIDTSGSRALAEWTVDLHLVIDGEEILTRVDGTATEAHAPIEGAASDGARLYEVTITNVGVTSSDEHEIQLTAYPKFVDGSGLVTWVYNTAEWDSGLVFNDQSPAATKIARNG